MGIQVMEQFVHNDQDAILDPECTRCGDCADICPQERLCEGVSMPV
jgi:ferredoxin